jgi:hypothetical protein
VRLPNLVLAQGYRSHPRDHRRTTIPDSVGGADQSTMYVRFRIADDSPEARERYFKRYTTVVSVSAGSGVGSPYISHECPADSLRLAAIHFPIALCASLMRW